MKVNRVFIFGLMLSILFSLLPFISLYVRVGGEPQIMPEMIDDSLYYFAREREVEVGNFLIGNPYFLNHSKDIAPTFFVPDWIASVPKIFGIDTNTLIILDCIIWTSIFYVLVFFLLKKFNVDPNLSAGASLGITLSLLWLLVRPVSMQVVFPFTALYFIALLDWLKNSNSRRVQVVFVTVMGLSFYIYTYLWQATCIILVLLFALELFKRNINGVYRIIKAIVLTIIIATPSLILLFKQLSHPLFWQTALRIGLVYTRSIGGAGLLTLGMVGAGLVVVQLIFKSNDYRKTFFVVTGTAFGILSISNIITNKDLEIAVHILRFIDLWLLLLITVIISSWGTLFSKSSEIKGLKFYIFIFGLLICLIRVVGIFNDSYSQIQLAMNKQPQEELAPVIKYLQSVPVESVVMANDVISAYVPIYTKNYVLFHPSGGLQLVSDDEIFERYSLSRVGTLTYDKMLSDMRLYRGVGPAEHIWRTKKRVAFYKNIITERGLLPVTQDTYSRESYYGKDYFYSLLKKDKELIEPHSGVLLENYKVSYIVTDSLHPQFLIPKDINIHEVYKDKRFTIYEIL